MKTSTQRILTTHVGSLPRPPDLLALILAKEQGAPFDAELYASRVKSAIAEVVKKQAEAGIDIVADGEMGRFGFIPYVNDRLAGIEARPNPGGEGTWARSREHLAFPEYYAWAAQLPGAAGGAQATQVRNDSLLERDGFSPSVPLSACCSAPRKSRGQRPTPVPADGLHDSPQEGGGFELPVRGHR